MNLEEARFGRVELVNALAGFVCDCHLDTPMTVGIYGKWAEARRASCDCFGASSPMRRRLGT